MAAGGRAVTAAARRLPTASGVLSASRLLAPHVVRTPVLECPLLNASLGGGRLLVKAESLQVTGSFKFRGAFHRLLCLRESDPEAADRGVVAYSSGNFGQALARAASVLGIRCTVVSPHDAPAVKLDRIKSYGATLAVSTADPGVNREVAASSLASSLSEERGYTLLHPFDDPDVIHGQGTIGVEFLDQAKDILGEMDMDTIVVPCGGGGMTAGICLAVEGVGSSSEVMTVEPAGFDDHAQSFSADGRRLTLDDIYGGAVPRNRSVACDALMASAPGRVTWPINGPRLKGAVAVRDDESVARAMRVAFEHFRLVLEPSGALGIAAVLDGLERQVHEDSVGGGSGGRNGVGEDTPVLGPGRVVGVIACGGNANLETYISMVNR